MSFIATALSPSAAPVQPARDSLLRRLLNPAPEFALLDAGDDQRLEAEAFVRAGYASAYGARVGATMPRLLSMSCLGKVSGVAGIRPAGVEPLFLESYLDQPIENLLGGMTGQAVDRAGIVEIGNLVASRRGASHLLFLMFTSVLHRAGYEWIVFTATRALRNNLDKLGFSFVDLAGADIARIPQAQRGDWGTYYDSGPRVVAGHLGDAMRIIRSRPLLGKILRMYRYPVNYMAAGMHGNTPR